MHGTRSEALQALRRRIGRGLTVDMATAPIAGWSLRHGRLEHEHADFFRIVGTRDHVGTESLLIRQTETALVGLLSARVDGERHVLLNARAEPGLHEGCQFSTTIQSTPSNYERRHGGAATPHLDYFVTPPPGARILHDSSQYDWGQYYDAKVKRFLIVEVDDVIEVSEPLVWVSESQLRDLLRADYSTTIDLRIAALYLLTTGRTTEEGRDAIDRATPVDATDDVPLDELLNWRIHPDGLDEIEPDQRLAVRYVTITADSREVASWSQPLLQVQDDLVVTSTSRPAGDTFEFAAERSTQRGLRGVELWQPFSDAVPIQHEPGLRASAEGGRFLRHRIDVVVGSARTEPTEWLSADEAIGLARRSGATSVEFRIALVTALLGAGS